MTTSTTSTPDPVTACTTTTTTTTITTTYTEHRGIYNGNGEQPASPPSTSTQSSTSSQACPPPSGPQASCQALGLNYAGATGAYDGQPIHFTCGHGNNLTISQAWDTVNSLIGTCRDQIGAWSTVWNS